MGEWEDGRMGLMHREMGQPSLVESLLPEKLGQNRRLERIHQAVV